MITWDHSRHKHYGQDRCVEDGQKWTNATLYWCGCGDEACEQFRKPTTGDYRPLPDYQQLGATLARYEQALERIIYEYPGEPLQLRTIACDALKNKL